MTQITLEIPEFYNHQLEHTAKTQQKTLQEIVLDAIRKFVETEEKNTDFSDGCSGQADGHCRMSRRLGRPT